MLVDECVPGEPGSESRPRYERKPLTADDAANYKPCSSYIEDVPLPDEVRELYMSGNNVEYYLGRDLTFFSPDYVVFLYKRDGRTIVAVECTQPFSVWSYTTDHKLMVRTEGGEIAESIEFDEFVNRYR